MMVHECVEGKGKMCGAIFVDEAFENMLRLAFGDKWKRLSVSSRKTLLNNEWEFGIKRLFDDSNREWNVTVPREADSKGIKMPHFKDKNGQPRVNSGQVKFGQYVLSVRVIQLDN